MGNSLCPKRRGSFVKSHLYSFFLMPGLAVSERPVIHPPWNPAKTLRVYLSSPATSSETGVILSVAVVAQVRRRAAGGTDSIPKNDSVQPSSLASPHEIDAV